MARMTLDPAVARGVMSVRAAASAIGIGRATLDRWEKGETSPPADKVDRMATVYDLDEREVVALVRWFGDGG